jgi:hypothetical protein
MSVVTLAVTDDAIEKCYQVMAELRPPVQQQEFLQRVKRHAETANYQLAYLTDGEVKAVAGFRISECLAWGTFLYVDDLVAKSGERSRVTEDSCWTGSLNMQKRKDVISYT